MDTLFWLRLVENERKLKGFAVFVLSCDKMAWFTFVPGIVLDT
jgi:hypothetical protein